MDTIRTLRQKGYTLAAQSATQSTLIDWQTGDVIMCPLDVVCQTRGDGPSPATIRPNVQNRPMLPAPPATVTKEDDAY